MKRFLIGLVIVAVCVTLPIAANAAEDSTPTKYKPAFDVKLDANTGPMVVAYLKASRSPTSDVAIKRWEAFLGEYAEDESIEDITDMTLLRQAHFELMRLYYMKGRITEADELLKKADDFAAFSVPEPAKAKLWCNQNKYCD
jgi:hypothetical protein